MASNRLKYVYIDNKLLKGYRSNLEILKVLSDHLKADLFVDSIEITNQKKF